jgi:hypothetical protein
LPRGRHQITRPNRLTRSATGSTIVVATLAAGLTTTWWPGHATAGQAPPARIGQMDAELAAAAQRENIPALVTYTKVRAQQEETAHAQRVAARRAARRATARRAARLAAARRAAEARREAAASHTSQSAPQPASAPAPSGSPQQIAMAMLSSYGWSSSQFSCLDSLWNAESGWSVTASNPSSGAYGIPQALPGSKMASAGPDWQTSATTQIRWGLGYIKGLYGSPCGAWDHEESTGWY